MKTLHARVTGNVQGVGFRVFVVGEARKRGLHGWVRNRRDGSVELAVSGEDQAVDALIAACRKGPPGASVRSVETDDHTGPISEGFITLPTK
ncbi:MAG: acylphosphatase [Bauldia sp.]|nr:acylphosphatase [Bauldia sp.]